MFVNCMKREKLGNYVPTCIDSFTSRPMKFCTTKILQNEEGFIYFTTVDSINQNKKPMCSVFVCKHKRNGCAALWLVLTLFSVTSHRKVKAFRTFVHKRRVPWLPVFKDSFILDSSQHIYKQSLNRHLRMLAVCSALKNNSKGILGHQMDQASVFDCFSPITLSYIFIEAGYFRAWLFLSYLPVVIVSI